VACDLDDLVCPAEHPEVSVVVSDGIVAGVEAAWETGPVDVSVTVRVLVDRQRHTRPGVLDDEVASLHWLLRLAMVVDDVRVYPWNSGSVGSRLHRDHVESGGVADEYSSGLGHPPCAAERDLVVTDVS